MNALTWENLRTKTAKQLRTLADEIPITPETVWPLNLIKAGYRIYRETGERSALLQMRNELQKLSR